MLKILSRFKTWVAPLSYEPFITSCFFLISFKNRGVNKIKINKQQFNYFIRSFKCSFVANFTLKQFLRRLSNVTQCEFFICFWFEISTCSLNSRYESVICTYLKAITSTSEEWEITYKRIIRVRYVLGKMRGTSVYRVIKK